MTGREALVHAEVGGKAGEIKALLEAHELILRGETRRRFAKAAITDIRVDGPPLQLTCAGEAAVLYLGL